MTKLTLSNLQNLQNESTTITTLTQNNVATSAALENTLSRDGTSPNQMNADFDMNSNRILNLPDALTDQEPATFSQLNDRIDSLTNGAVISASYVTLANDPQLQNERVLTAGTNLGIADTGPNGEVIVSITDPELNSIASLTSANNQVPYFTGSGTADLLAVTDYTKTVLDDVDAPTLRATIGLDQVDNTSDATKNAATVTLTNKTIDTASPNTIKINGNTLSATAGTATVTVPNSTDTLVGRATTDTLTNKTLTLPVIASISNSGTVTLPTGTHTLVARDTADTLTNKTLTAPVISTISNTGTLTLPTSTDTLVGRATTDTLTNKTISGSNNTLSNIANTSLSNSTITVGSTSTSLGGTLSATTGRGPNGLNIDQVTGHGDSNYTILSTDRNVFTTAALTATRTWTLPAANSVNAGQSILIADLAGGVTSSNLLTVQRAGTDTINGTTSVSLSAASTSVEVISDGTSKWYAVQSSSGGGGGGASSFKRYEYTATAGQTTFSGADVNSNTLLYTPGFVIVTVNGDAMATADYTATSGTSIVFSVGRAVNDQVSMIAMNQSAVGLIPGNNLSDVVSKATSISNLKVSGITTQTFTSGTAATYTTPANCTWIEVYMVGGGGGGAGCFNGVGAGTAGSNGTKSSFNGIDAAPGLGGQIQVSGTSGQSGAGGAGGTGGTGTATRRMPGQPGHSATNSSITFTSPAAAGGSSVLFGGGGAPPVDTGTHTTVGNAGVANTGGGGSGAYDIRTTNNNVGSGGGAGESVYLIINSPSPTYTYTVGTGGTGGVSSTNGGAGAAGQIQVIEHYGLP